jgi:hypothetical protein
MTILVDCLVGFARNLLLALQRFKREDDILSSVVEVYIPLVNSQGQVAIETTVVDAGTVLVLSLSSLLFIRSGFIFICDSAGCLRELHKWKRWGKQWQSTWSHSEPAHMLLYFTVIAAMKSKRQLIFIGASHLILGHLFLVFSLSAADSRIFASESINYDLVFQFLYCIALAMGLKVTWEIIRAELSLILDMRVGWSWASSKLTDKSLRGSNRIKLCSEKEEESSRLLHHLFSHKMRDQSNPPKIRSTAGGGAMYQIKMEELQTKCGACMLLLNLFSIRPVGEPCGPLGTFSVQSAEDKLAAVSVDLKTLEVTLVEAAQRDSSVASAASCDSEIDVATMGTLAKRYIRSKHRTATFYLCLWGLNAIAIGGLAFATLAYFDSVYLLGYLIGVSKLDQGVQSPEHLSMMTYAASGGKLAADLALAFEAVAILSRQV